MRVCHLCLAPADTEADHDDIVLTSKMSNILREWASLARSMYIKVSSDSCSLSIKNGRRPRYLGKRRGGTPQTILGSRGEGYPMFAGILLKLN